MEVSSVSGRSAEDFQEVCYIQMTFSRCPVVRLEGFLPLEVIEIEAIGLAPSLCLQKSFRRPLDGNRSEIEDLFMVLGPL